MTKITDTALVWRERLCECIRISSEEERDSSYAGAAGGTVVGLTAIGAGWRKALDHPRLLSSAPLPRSERVSPTRRGFHGR